MPAERMELVQGGHGTRQEHNMRRRSFSFLGSIFLSFIVMVGLAQPASAADFVVSHVDIKTHPWSFTHSYSGSCYLENGVRWTLTAKWNFGHTTRQTVRVDSVQVSYFLSAGGSAGGAYLQDEHGAGVWESNYNNRSIPAGTTYAQTFDVGGRVVSQGPNGVHFHVGVNPGDCGGTTLNASFYIRSK